MRRFVALVMLVSLCVAVQVPAVQAQEEGGGGGVDLIEDRTKLAQTGMQFLSVSLDPRAAAMGSALTAAQRGGAVNMFYNPAGMRFMESGVDLRLGQNRWIGDIRYNYGGVAYRPAGGAYGTIGVSIRSVNYGDLLGTIRADNKQGFEDTGTFSPSALAVGLGYARTLTDRFSVGANVKYARQSLGPSIMRLESAGDLGSAVTQDNTQGTVAVDFGVIYRTGFRSLNFAASIRNFSRELTYAEESFELPLTFRIGTSMDVMDVVAQGSEMHSLLLSVEAMHPRDNVEQVAVGGEYMFMETIALRAGYRGPRAEEGMSLGGGLRHSLGDLGFGFDYAYQAYGIFNNVHRLAINLNIK